MNTLVCLVSAWPHCVLINLDTLGTEEVSLTVKCRGGGGYSGTPHSGHHSTTAIYDITANSPGPDQSTVEPLYNSHLCITAKIQFPNSGRYGGVPLYNAQCVLFMQGVQNPG